MNPSSWNTPFQYLKINKKNFLHLRAIPEINNLAESLVFNNFTVRINLCSRGQFHL